MLLLQSGSVVPKQRLNIYPNPTSENLFIKIPTDIKSDFTLCLFSLTGEKLFNANYTGLTTGECIRLSKELESLKGIYILQLATNSQVLTQKVIIQ